MANGTLSSYFEKQKDKNAPSGGVAAYSVPATMTESTGGPAPAGGGSAPSAPSAPKGAAGGGTGFVSFGQYFGGNAPAVQAQAQKAVESAKGARPSAMNAPVGAPGLGAFKTVSFGPTPSAGTMAARQAMDPLTRQMNEAQRQSTNLNALTQPGGAQTEAAGSMGSFDALLSGGLVQRAAKQEQQRLGALRAALQDEQARYAQEDASRAQQEQAQYEADRQKEEADWYARQEEERKYYEALRAQQEQAAAMDEEGSYQYQAPEEYDDLGEGGY
jgi:hypothetical protein